VKGIRGERTKKKNGGRIRSNMSKRAAKNGAISIGGEKKGQAWRRRNGQNIHVQIIGSALYVWGPKGAASELEKTSRCRGKALRGDNIRRGKA